MSKVSKILAISALFSMSLGLAGCQNVAAPTVPEKASEVVLQESVNKLAEVTSYAYDVNLVGNLKGPKAEKPEVVTFNLNFNGDVEMKDPKDPKLSLNVKGDMMADADGGSGELSFKLNKEAIFLDLMKLEGKGQVVIPGELKSQFIDKWWTMPLPPVVLEELVKAAPKGSVNLTEDQKKLKDLAEKTKFFKDVQLKGVEDVNGQPSYHYSAVLDKVAVNEFIAKANELQGSAAMTDSSKQSLKEALDHVDFTGEMYVGKDSGVLVKMTGVVNVLENSANSSPSGTISFDLTVKDLNKPVTLEIPKDAQPIPMDLLQSLPL